MRQFAVIGLGRFGASLAKTLTGMGHEVLGVDANPEKVQALSGLLTHVIEADATDAEVLKNLGLRNFDVVAVSIGSDLQASVMATLNLKELGVKHVVAKAMSDMHAKVLYKTGADRVVFPERDMGTKVARSLAASNVLDYIELAPHISICEVTAGKCLVGKNLGQLALRARYGVNVMAIKRGQAVNVSPKAGDVVMENDILVVIGEISNIRRLNER